MKILVTGGAGFIGSNFIRHVLSLRRSYSIVNLDKLTYAGNLTNLQSVDADPNYRFVKGDICDPVAVADAMRDCECRSSLCGGISCGPQHLRTRRSNRHQCHGHLRLAAGRTTNEPAVASFTSPLTKFMATCRPQVTSNEEFPAAAQQSRILLRRPARTCWSGRLCAPMASRPSSRALRIIMDRINFRRNFFLLIITNALDGKKLPVYGDGLQQRDWLHVTDHCRGILAVLESGRVGEVYNIGGERRHRQSIDAPSCADEF